ncbi:hypothetical protein ABBQ32_009474 [Trebouxia sp. C0010 RCD-2024]
MYLVCSRYCTCPCLVMRCLRLASVGTSSFLRTAWFMAMQPPHKMDRTQVINNTKSGITDRQASSLSTLVHISLGSRQLQALQPAAESASNIHSVSALAAVGYRLCRNMSILISDDW